jgi:Uri superfamily endonuclease
MAELEEAKGTSDVMNGVVVSAHASQIPAGFGSSDVQVKSSLYSPQSKEQNTQQAEQGHAQMQQCV